MRSVTYVRQDGSVFEGPLFHLHMETVTMPDPATGKILAFRSVVGFNRKLLYRMEVSNDKS